MKDYLKPSLAELIGTFTLVFIGAGAGALAGGDEGAGGILAVALAHGGALITIVYAWGSISGAHVNPAVTFALAVCGKIEWPKAVAYWIAQLLGGILAGYLLLYLLGADLADKTGLGQTIGILSDSAKDTYDPTKTIVLEAVLTFFLLIAVFGSAVAGRNGDAVGLAIAGIIVMDILAGGYLTGASMNPARTLGPALAMGNLSNVWMYFVGPTVGATVGALVFDRLYLAK